jgi:hypothetical protein
VNRAETTRRRREILGRPRHSSEQSRARRRTTVEIRARIERLPQVETQGLTNEGWGVARTRVDGGDSPAAQEMLR